MTNEEVYQYEGQIMLRRLGITPEHPDYLYFVESISMALEDDSRLQWVIKSIYQEIAAHHGVYGWKVERNLRRGVDEIWENNSLLVKAVLEYPFDEKPTVSQFIGYAAGKISEKIYRQEHPNMSEGEKHVWAAERLLRRMGITARYTGYHYYAEEISMLMDDNDRLTWITKTVYPEIAANHNTTAMCVERDLRIIINVIWTRDPELFKEVVNYWGDIRPTTREFLECAVRILSEQEKRRRQEP